MKTISKQQVRQKTVSNVLASLRIENLQPSPEVVRGLKACMAGQDTTDHLRQQVMTKRMPVGRTHE